MDAHLRSLGRLSDHGARDTIPHREEGAPDITGTGPRDAPQARAGVLMMITDRGLNRWRVPVHLGLGRWPALDGRGIDAMVVARSIPSEKRPPGGGCNCRDAGRGVARDVREP